MLFSLSGSVQGPTQLRVMVGSVSLSEATTYYSISKIVPHSKFMFNILKADIALLQTDKEIQFTTTVQRIDLQTEPLVKVKAFVCGWGILGRDRTLPDRLQYLDTEILPLATCNKLLEKHGVTPADKSQICDLSGKQRQSSKGDSGSPLVSNGKQIGLVSYGVYGTAIPSVNTNVSYFYDWIQETISGNSYMLNTKHKGNTFETQTVF